MAERRTLGHIHRDLVDRDDGVRGFEVADRDGYVLFFGRPRSHRRKEVGLKPTKEFAIGVEDHYGYAQLVSIAISGPDLMLIDKRRVALIDPHLPGAPYHHDTLKMPPREAEQLVRDVRASADRLALVAIESLLGELAPATCRVLAIRVPPLPELPASVAEAHANPWIMNRADGLIPHQALTSAATRLKLSVFHFDKSRILEQAAQARGQTPAALEGRLKALGKAQAPPWRKGQMIACAGALLALDRASARHR